MSRTSPSSITNARLSRCLSPSLRAPSRGLFAALVGLVGLTSAVLAQSPGQDIVSVGLPSLRAVRLAAPSPILDGNIDDVLAFAAEGADCGLTATDPAQDVCKTDPILVPCAAEVDCPLGGGAKYFVNGFDFTQYVVAYQEAGGNLYLGFRVVGQIGDSNGDGSPNNTCVMPGANIADPGEIAVSEQYLWEIDTNCDGTPDITIEVRGDQVNVFGTAFDTKDFAFNGTDLEVHVSGVTLPVVWRARPFVGSTTDGMSEDTAIPTTCPLPNLDVEIEKTAEPTALCPGDNTTFSITVTNTGDAPLTVTLVDDLPAGLVYNDNVSGDFTVDTVVGQQITFNDLVIPKGESRSVSFEATAGAECFGEVTNVASVTGTFDEPCLTEPLGIGPVTAEAVVRCKDVPCVALDRDCPETACEGDQILLSATATSCSRDPEDITITIAGEDTTFLDVPGGESVTWERWVVHGPCVEGQVTYSFAAVATNDCGTTEPELANCTVLCSPEPCVELVDATGPASICTGDDVEICVEGQNCSPGLATIVLRAGDQAKVFEDVAEGGTVEFCFTFLEQACVVGEALSYPVSATAITVCDSTTVRGVVDVACNPKPCVEITGTSGPGTICSGDDVEICVEAQNCTQGPATIVLRINDQAKVFPDVAQGATVEFCFTFEDQACVVGLTPTYDVSATATTVCDSVTVRDNVVVACNPEPCVEITDTSGPGTICSGDDVEICVEAQNCTQGPATIVLRIEDQAKVFPNVAQGATVEFCFTFLDQACVVGETLNYDVSATATTVCDSTTVTDNVEVSCNPEPCVEITDTSGPGSICTGDDVEICVEAQNCTQGPATIVLRIEDQAKVFPNVAQGATVEFCFTFLDQACVTGEGLSYDVSATATTVCDSTTVRDNVEVACNPEPCLELLGVTQPQAICSGDDVEICLEAQNCSDGPADVVIRIGDNPRLFPAVAAGGVVEYCYTYLDVTCLPGQPLEYVVSATVSTTCDSTSQESLVLVQCNEPEIDVEKEASVSEAFLGDTYTYTITVRNTGNVTLYNVKVSDDICDQVSFAGNANPAPSSAPVIGTPNGTIEWTLPSLAVDGVAVFTFDVTVEECGTPCVNTVDVEGFCSPTSDLKATDHDEITTPLICNVDNCPRTPGFWTQQCAQKGNGSEKFDQPVVAQIADCVDDNSDFFDWSDDFTGFCVTVNPERPMTQYKQLQRHFAVLLANYCTGHLDLIANNGDEIALDLSTPIDCPGVDAETIGELIEEIDDALQSGNSAKYGALLECADAINNGIGIPTAEDCGDETSSRTGGSTGDSGLQTTGGSGDVTGDEADLESLGDGFQPLLELYAPAPNPFSHITRIDYAVGGNGEQVDISVYDVSGRKLRGLVNGYAAPGRHQVAWDGRTDDGVQVTPGVYFLRAFVGGQRIAASPRMLYVR